jgi:hypothetical protein
MVYRVHFAPIVALQSLFKIHNEVDPFLFPIDDLLCHLTTQMIVVTDTQTGNIWSHLIGFFAMIALAIRAIIHLHSVACSVNHTKNNINNDSNHSNDGTTSASMMSFTWLDVTVLTLFYACALTCLLSSSIFHLFFCCSTDVHMRLYRMDLLGVFLLIWGSYLPGLYTGFHCLPFYQVSHSISNHPHTIPFHVRLHLMTLVGYRMAI